MINETFSKSEEIVNAILHGIGLGLAIAALVILIVFASLYGSTWHIVSFTIYGASLVILYLSSTLYHSLSHGRYRHLFQIIDHSAIYILIAGTYTPFTFVTLRGTLGWSVFGVVWGLALLGILFKAKYADRFVIFSTSLYIAMGWLLLFVLKPIVAGIGTTGTVFLFTGGILYTVGTIFYIWKLFKYHHAVWHLFVLGGSIFHFFTVLSLI